jgi:P27 family predicted phage terminase small subunit
LLHNATGATMTTQPKLTTPDDLSAEALAKWDELIDLLTERGVSLIPEDTDRLREYCDAFTLRKRAVREMAGQPLLLAGPNGAKYTNPLMKIIKQAEQTLHRISAMYGLDLKSRLAKDRQGMGAVMPDDPFLKFLRSEEG